MCPGYCGHHRCAAGLFMLLPAVCLGNGFHTCEAEFFELVAAEEGSSVSARENI